jgi:outer membrane protein
LETLTQKALASRPELEAWQREAQAFRWQKKQALASRGPQLAMGAQLEWAKPNPRYFPLTDRLRESWAVGLSGTWQLGDGGQAQAAAKTAEALAQAAEASQKEQQRRIALEVEQAYQRLADALALLKAVEANRHAALARQEAISDRFQAGLVSFSELLEAQTALATAELEAVDAKAEVFLAWSQLRRALGE